MVFLPHYYIRSAELFSTDVSNPPYSRFMYKAAPSREPLYSNAEFRLSFDCPSQSLLVTAALLDAVDAHIAEMLSAFILRA